MCQNPSSVFLYIFCKSQNDDTHSVEIINKATLSKISALESELNQANSEITHLRRSTDSASLKGQNDQLMSQLQKTQLHVKVNPPC